MDAYLIGSYIGHMARARDRHSVHSPFVYDLVEQVLRPDHGPPSADRIEALRKSALKDTTTLAVTDHGAGPRRGRSSTRTVATIAATH
jgi:hypothetical protein